MNILVTGGSGRLGRALAAVGGATVRALSRSDLDVTDRGSVVVTLERLRPSAVINAAVVSGIDRLEVDPKADLTP